MVMLCVNSSSVGALSLPVRFSIRIPIRFGVRFAAKGVKQGFFLFFFADMCQQTIAMGKRKRIGSLFCFCTNLARNRTAICTQIRTPVDSPLATEFNILPGSLMTFGWWPVLPMRDGLKWTEMTATQHSRRQVTVFSISTFYHYNIMKKKALTPKIQ
jgi:hypothetical protein